jgi:hypothetical protein
LIVFTVLGTVRNQGYLKNDQTQPLLSRAPGLARNISRTELTMWVNTVGIMKESILVEPWEFIQTLLYIKSRCLQ